MSKHNFDLNHFSQEELNLLPERERDVLMRYYWNDETLADIGQHYNLTRSRIGQLRDKAIQRLRGLTGKMG